LKLCHYRKGTEEISDEYWRHKNSVCAHGVCMYANVCMYFEILFASDVIFENAPEVNISLGKNITKTA